MILRTGARVFKTLHFLILLRGEYPLQLVIRIGHRFLDCILDFRPGLLKNTLHFVLLSCGQFQLLPKPLDWIIGLNAAFAPRG